MMKFLKLPYIWLIPGIVFFFAAYGYVAKESYLFGFYGRKYFGRSLFDADTVFLIMAILLALAAFGAMFWARADVLMDSQFNCFSYVKICVIVAIVVAVSALSLEVYHPPYMMILAPAATSAAALALIATTIVRLRAAMLRELARLAESYRIANEEKIQAERFKTELIANVSHDIRTPLTSIINYVDLIDRLGLQNNELNEYVAILRKTSDRLKTLIGDLLDATKAGTGNVTMDIKTINLTEILGQVAGDFETAFAAKKLTYILYAPRESTPGSDKQETCCGGDADTAHFVSADGKHLCRVLENLLGNVAKYAMSGTRVYVELSAIGAEVSLSVKNISERQLDVSPEMLTERFVQGDRSRNAEGNGLGLYIAKNLLEGMGGRLDVRIDGDLFVSTVTLPAAKEPPVC